MISYKSIIGTPKKGDIVLITERTRSLDNGATWHTMRTVEHTHEWFNGEKLINGPSESGFWGNCNEIRSGSYFKYCSEFDGKRWRSKRNIRINR